LYAFPVQQLSAMLFTDFWTALLFSTLVTVLLATLSAVLIERYALRLKNRTAISWPAKKMTYEDVMPTMQPAKIGYDGASAGDSA
jgi:peptidoglycan/LPS O-acetylase OafA/YrhL